MITFSKTDKSLMVVIIEDGKRQVYTATASHPRWNDILDALKKQDQEQLVNLMSIKKMVESYTESNVEIKDNNVFFKGHALHGLDVERLLEFSRDGIPFLPLARFLERKQKNPSYRSINELYKFLEHREMTLTPEGKVIGYKGVRDDYYSIMGNTSTIMVSGETDSSGHILNTIGAEIRCDRSCVCDDYKQGCSPGLHIGSLAYAKGWGPRVLTVEFDPADVVSVPDDCECQKLRACAYKVIGECKGEAVEQITIKDQVVNDDVYNDYEDESEGYDTEYDDYEDESESEEDSTSSVNQSYEDGFQLGVKEGKAHKARKFYVTDLDDESLSDMEYSYIKGYNNGYSKGRYNKGK